MAKIVKTTQDALQRAKGIAAETEQMVADLKAERDLFHGLLKQVSATIGEADFTKIPEAIGKLLEEVD